MGAPSPASPPALPPACQSSLNPAHPSPQSIAVSLGTCLHNTLEVALLSCDESCLIFILNKQLVVDKVVLFWFFESCDGFRWTKKFYIGR